MSEKLFIQHADIQLEDGLIQDGWLFSEDGIIKDFGANFQEPPETDAEIIDADGLTLLPGFIDLHVHGAMGYDTMDASPEALNAMSRFYAEHGTTAFLATTWTDTQERIYAALQAVRKAMATGTSGAQLLGVHLEGPYLNADKSGAQNPDLIRRAEPDNTQELLNTDVIRLVSLAPEFHENDWLIEECVRRGIIVSVAHSAAKYDETMDAINRGLSHSTHTFNAMPGLHHREPGVLGAVLTDDRVYCELIADGIHVHPAGMEILWRCKGADRLILVTDAMSAAGMPDGEYPVDDRVIIVKDGIARLENGALAGSRLTMNTALANLMEATGASLQTLWRTASLTPAQNMGIADRKGSIQTGKDADLILVDEQVDVHLTIVNGNIRYRKESYVPH